MTATLVRVDRAHIVAALVTLAALLLVLKAGLDVQNASDALHVQAWWTR